MPSTDYAKLAVRIHKLNSEIINNEISDEEIVEEAHKIGGEVIRVIGTKS